MFEALDGPRVFAMPPGADFGADFAQGLIDLSQGLAPEAFARAQIYVNTARMQRRLLEVLDQGPALLLPQIRLLSDVSGLIGGADVPAPASPLRIRLELANAVAKLLDQDRSLAPRAALFQLSDSLANLMDEMQGEGVDTTAIDRLDVSDQSGHWQRALAFIRILEPYFAATSEAPDREARQRMVIEATIAHWKDQPPRDPIIIAGSTGSRGATSLLMQAVAQLPQGALVLPGYDFDMPDAQWPMLGDADGMAQQDHPQFRFHKLITGLDMAHRDVNRWPSSRAPDPDRNRLISLSVRPAPVTSQWLNEGPTLGNLRQAAAGITLVEAQTPRAEAEAIALRLRQAAAEGITAALISPDRMLTRQVAAALDRWDIQPDDSAGVPLPQSAPGRMLRHVGALMGNRMTTEHLLVLLKHPLAHGAGRNEHLRLTRELELGLRRRSVPFPDAAFLEDWVKHINSSEAAHWVDWVRRIIESTPEPHNRSLDDWLAAHLELTALICRGHLDPEGSGALWEEKAGREALRVCDLLRRDADAGGIMGPSDYLSLFNGVLAQGVVRDRDSGHPNILIWGTLEARVQGADLVILGGMNENAWPAASSPDPWLNRAMRAQAGLLLPERQIGLAAHDYQQAVAANEVWITRSKRTQEAETVPSRWINRLTNLLAGLPDQDGPSALAEMRSRGAIWLQTAATYSEPEASTERARRPSPCPPITARPRKFSVTQIKTLVRDPYAIYARKVLRLDPLNTISPEADAPLRGIIFHQILDDFIATRPDASHPDALDQFMEIAKRRLAERCPWPTIAALWLSRLYQIAPTFLAQEAERQKLGRFELSETRGALLAEGPDVTLTCTADRIDLTPEGAALIYDYKTGPLPSENVQLRFDKQLLLEAAMVTRGGFEKLGSKQVAGASFLGIRSDMDIRPAPIDKAPPDQTWAEFTQQMENWLDPSQGYSARQAYMLKSDASPYDHLSRFGEWDMNDPAEPEDVA